MSHHNFIFIICFFCKLRDEYRQEECWKNTDFNFVHIVKIVIREKNIYEMSEQNFEFPL